MSTLFIKGTVMGLSKEDWLSNPQYLTSSALSVLQNWYMQHHNTDGTYKSGLSPVCRKHYGEVTQALFALENDLHNLSIIYHQLLHFKACDIEVGLKDLYFSNLTESYFTNIRSAYDHLSSFPTIVLEEAKLKRGVGGLTSFNDLLKVSNVENAEKRAKAEEVYGNQLLASFDQSRTDFYNVREVRDAIIHHGKEPVVTSKGEEVVFSVPAHVGNYNSNNILPNILHLENPEYPLFEYLRSVTISLFTNMERIGNSIGKEYLRLGGRIEYRYGLIGICINDFNTFLFPDGKVSFFRVVQY